MGRGRVTAARKNLVQNGAKASSVQDAILFFLFICQLNPGRGFSVPPCEIPFSWVMLGSFKDHKYLHEGDMKEN